MSDGVKPTFERALEDHKASIFRICKTYAEAPVEPEDLFQEVTMHLWKAFPSFEGKSSLHTWVYRIALNVCMRSKSQLSKRSENTVRLESIQFDPTPSIVEDQEEKSAALHHCIRQLEESDQSIVILSLEGLAYKEMAHITGLTENHIAVKMKRLKKKLLNCINSKLKNP